VKDKRDELFRRDLPIADASKLLKKKVEPVEIENSDSINKVAPHNEKFKWVLTMSPELKLWAIPILDLKRPPVSTNKDVVHKDDEDDITMYEDDIIKHVIVTRGLPVQSAGEAQRQGDKIVIDNGSGHYQPTFKSLQRWAEDAFVEKARFKRENIELHKFEKGQKYFK